MFSKGVLWLLPCHQNERSSNHLKENRKRMVLCPTRTRGFSSQIWHEVTSIEVRHWSEVVCGFFFNAFTTLFHSQCQCPHRWLETWMDGIHTAVLWWWWWWLLKRVKRAHVLFECQFDSRETQTLFLMMLQKVERTRQKYNSWPPDPSRSRPVSHPVTVLLTSSPLRYVASRLFKRPLRLYEARHGRLVRVRE